MDSLVKKLILREGSKSQVLLTKKRMKTFQFSTDEVEVSVVGKLIGEVVYFRVAGEDLLYALKGDRFYTVEDTTIWQEDVPKSESLPEAAPIVEAKETPKEKVVLDGPFYTQLGYHGEFEEVPSFMYKHLIECECGSNRYVKSSDLFQVKYCKPCTMARRKQMGKERRCLK
jgi:hypothetical protein